MSLLDLLYLEETQADAVIGVVHKWCSENGFDISSDNGKLAVAEAVRLVKSADGDDLDLFEALSEGMAALVQPAPVPYVLIVEDEPLIALDMELTLEVLGFPVKACMSRLEALEWLERKTPSAAVLDFQLKDGSCTEIALLLQQRGVPIIVCSGADRNEVSSILGDVPWLCKPANSEQLADMVRQALEDRRFPRKSSFREFIET